MTEDKKQELNYLDMLNRIKKLEADLHDCRNELCLRCEKYKEAWQGACGECRWRNIG